MNSKTPQALSSYQNAILSEMGIVVWQPQNSAISETKFATQGVGSNQDSAQNGNVDSNTAVAPIAANKSQTPIPESIKQFRTQKATQPDKRSVPNHLVFEFSLDMLSSALVEDVLLSIGFEGNSFERLSEIDCEQHIDYEFAWKIGKGITLEGRLLTTPSLTQTFSPSAKKQLWSVLSTLAND
ncbi:DNA polymerase III subunit psi [Paraglaciecola sp. 20A4]|uniref:DNA polymerase III subunit psi n=1 Tax=Paraglaciecola sp. 20A4 TaxID=2687288 RepID=UPI00140AF4D9|nr:DNA polymerase III subunit psi [Paraglaciecola sp. 20A4]